MKDIIRRLLIEAKNTENKVLADITSDLMCELSSSDKYDVCDMLYEEFKNDDWLIKYVYEFAVMAS